MATSVAELRAKIARGEIKTGGQGQGGVGEGVFDIMVEKAEYGPGQNANIRGMLVCKVIGAADAAVIGRTFNIYLQTQNSSFMEQTIAEYAGICERWGIPEDKIYEECDTLEDIIGNICMRINRLAIKGMLFGQVERKVQTNKDGTVRNNVQNGKPYYWNNWLGVSTKDAGQPDQGQKGLAPDQCQNAPAPAPQAPAPTPTPAPAPRAAAQQSVPAPQPPAPSAGAPEASAPQAPAKKKPWQK